MTTSKRLRAIKDRRTVWYRRHCELAAAFASDLGSGLSAADRSYVDHAATIAVACEQLKVSQLNGETVNVDDLVGLTNSLTRVRIELGKRAATKERAPTLEEYLGGDE